MKQHIISLLKLQKLYGTEGLYLPQNSNIIVNNDNKHKQLVVLQEEVKQCKKCHLWKTRINTVFGEGDINAELMFVGEGPGYEEDKQGRPFVGPAGELLTKIISAMGLSREKVYITNVVKCHPLREPDPYLRNNDRPPTQQEISSCLPYLEKQIEIIRPKVICCLGSTAARVLTGENLPITELCGKIFGYEKLQGVKIVPTYHPAALLRNPSLKKQTWNDMKTIMKILGIKK